MRKPKKEIHLTSYEELLGIEDNQENSVDKITEIPIDCLYGFKNHPFHVINDEKMQETVDSIKEYGVLNPCIVRPREDGGYEIISGHRRKYACQLAGKAKIPAIIRNYTDDEATIIMVDSNIQREHILPSEKAHAYAMKYEALKHQGVKGRKNTADMVGEMAGDSSRTVQRYIRLSKLVPGLLKYVDNGELQVASAEQLAGLPEEEQKIVEEVGKYGTEVQRQKTAEYNGDAISDMQNKGVTLVTLTDEEKQQFRDAVNNIYPLVKEKMKHPELFDQVLEKTQ